MSQSVLHHIFITDTINLLLLYIVEFDFHRKEDEFREARECFHLYFPTSERIIPKYIIAMMAFFYRFVDLHWNHSYVSSVLDYSFVTNEIELKMVGTSPISSLCNCECRKFPISFRIGFFAPHTHFCLLSFCILIYFTCMRANEMYA